LKLVPLQTSRRLLQSEFVTVVLFHSTHDVSTVGDSEKINW